MKCGYVGVFGRANAGKSTLVNALVGEQVAIVSSKPQTTRDNILGIVNGGDYQIILVDTPGIHHSKNLLDKAMMKNVRSALAGVDVILYLIDGQKEVDDEESDYIEHLKDFELPLLVVKTKKDKKCGCKHDCDLYISAKTGEGLEQLKSMLVGLLPEGQKVFDDDYFTDKSVKFLIAEKAREVALNLLHDEVPHGVCVQIDKFDEKGNITVIEGNVVCEQERHKAIIVGKGGENIKKIGEQTRIYAQELLGQKVLLKLFVKVDKNWRDRPDKVAAYRSE